MLALKRYLKERIVVTVPPSTTETRIEIQVVDATKDWAKLGCEAPARVVIDREEIAARKSMDRKLAASR